MTQQNQSGPVDRDVGRPDYRAHARSLIEPAMALVAGVLEKHSAAVLEGMHEEIRAYESEIARLQAANEALVRENQNLRAAQVAMARFRKTLDDAGPNASSAPK